MVWRIVGDGGHARSCCAVINALPVAAQPVGDVLGFGDTLGRCTAFNDAGGGIEGFTARTAVVYGRILSGVQVFEMAYIGPGAVVGENVVVNTAAVIEHDCSIGAHSHIAPRAMLCGGVMVGARTLVGAGAVIHPGIRIGCGCVVGCGSVVVKDVPDGATVMGNPAR